MIFEFSDKLLVVSESKVQGRKNKVYGYTQDTGYEFVDSSYLNFLDHLPVILRDGEVFDSVAESVDRLTVQLVSNRVVLPELLDEARASVVGYVADGPVMTGEAAAAKYLQLKAGGREHEVFGCLFLTTRNRPIRDEELFYGSIDHTTVHPRVILQKALKLNASALICYHNHPSSVAEPSASDMGLTSRMKDLLDEIDVRLLDHIVLSRTETVSMAARRLI